MARVKLAITALGPETEGLKAYQYVPVALAITAASTAASGGRPQRSAIAVETEVVDSVSGERLALEVRGGTGERLQKVKAGNRVVRFEDLKPIIDYRLGALAEEMAGYVKTK